MREGILRRLLYQKLNSLLLCNCHICTGDVAMEDTARVSLIQQVAAAFCASSGPQCRVTDPVDPHVLYAQHIHRQLKELRVPEHKQAVLERFEPAMREVLVRLVRVYT